MSLAEKVESAYAALIGNRVTLAANLMAGGTVYTLLESNNPGLRVLVSISIPAAGVILFGTQCGIGTSYFYQRTKKHIQKYGHLKPRVVELWITHKTENMPEVGYCQLQGIYLAAKKYNQLDTFYEAKKKVSKVKIPNF